MTKLEIQLAEALAEMIRVWPVSVCDSPMCGHCLERKTALLNAKIAAALYRNTAGQVSITETEAQAFDLHRPADPNYTAADVLDSKPEVLRDFMLGEFASDVKLIPTPGGRKKNVIG